MAKKLGKYEKYFATTNKLCKLAIAQWGQIRIFMNSCGFTKYFCNFATIIDLMAKKYPVNLGKLAIAQWGQIRICHVLLRFYEIFSKLCNYSKLYIPSTINRNRHFSIA